MEEQIRTDYDMINSSQYDGVKTNIYPFTQIIPMIP